jgi:hypothetical protein
LRRGASTPAKACSIIAANPTYALDHAQGGPVTGPTLPGRPRRATELIVHCHGERPYFAEVPYFVWGAVDYASSGDAQTPTDREWRELGLVNRETGEILEMAPVPDSGRRVVIAVRAMNPDVALRAAYFLTWRTDGQAGSGPDAALETFGELARRLGEWDYKDATARSVRVRKDFGRAELLPFDDNAFWPSWKWVGVPACARTRVGRWIMDSVLRKDTRAVYLCIEWLRRGSATPVQRDALCYALQRFTGRELPSPADWVAWYAREGAAAYPRPDFATWWATVPH